ncbi:MULTISPECIES: zinc-binding dehydrogenase [unclassified Nocardioides]|uniref:zinc-binding dehydrogenase n=1 Tax=unclassified Nocardioides TaxID=2615069 RepID=UPI0006F4C853|nr:MULTISPECIES: zinc-binding dehydrogenase [unclassified Nocardioides]KRA32551.1 alcohol dehydrogenase [Nocardioides sp. Root614]KRA89204.1 alcohol dehydrogenase [Nocardioides sp. Root682]
MKAVVCRDTKLEVTDVPAPEPGRGHLLLDVHGCGICGSDLHARTHADDMAEAAAASGYDGFMRSGDSVVFGHEFCGEVVDRGPRTSKEIKIGTRVVAMPILRTGGAVHTTGLSPHAPGAYAEQVVVQAALAMPVPNGLPSDRAALTEPMAVGLHAVRRGQVKKGQIAVVIGCGPIGLAVISLLKASGVRTVIASDFSAGRRALAAQCGADVVVNPATESPYDSAKERGKFITASGLFDLAIDSMSKLRAVPLLPWWTVMETAEKLGAMPEGPVVFECVGVPGIIDQVIASAPIHSRVVVVGVCMGSDSIRPAIAINKEIDLRFVLGYTPTEFREALHLMADGKVDPTPLMTGTVGLAGVEAAFTALGDPEKHAKILVDPRSEAVLPG